MKITFQLSAFVAVAAFVCFAFSVSEKQIKGSRFRYKISKVRTNGNCPDSIIATVYDAVKKETLRYSFKTSVGANSAGQYYTIVGDSKAINPSTIQIIDCSQKTLAAFHITSLDKLPEIKIPK